MAIPTIEFDARLQPNFLMICCGSTRSGKSTFVKQLIRTPDMWQQYPEEIVISYQAAPEQYDDLPGVRLVDGMPDMDALCSTPHHKLLVLDDMTAALIDKHASMLDDCFCIRSHHANLSIVLVCHNPYIKSLRTPRLNAGYLVFFRSIVDSSHLSRFAAQSHPGRARVFLDAYHQATTAQPYGYLLFDAHPLTDDRLRLRARILDTPQHVYYETPAQKR